MPTYKRRTSATITIKRMVGVNETNVLEVLITKSCRRTFKLMEKDEITLVFSSTSAVHFHIGDYVDDEIFGRFVVMQEQTPKYNNKTAGYDYQLVLVAPYRVWNNHEFTLTNGSAISSGTITRKECSWLLTDNLKANVKEFIRCLSAIGETYNSLPYVMNIHATAEERDEVHLMTYDSIPMVNALNAMAETWHCEWWVKYEVPAMATGDILVEANAQETAVTGNVMRGVIHFGKCRSDEHTYSMSEKQLTIDDTTYKPTADAISAQRSGGDYANRLFVLGGTNNIPDSYRKTLTLYVMDSKWDGKNNRHVYRPNRKLTEEMLDGAAVATETVSVKQLFSSYTYRSQNKDTSCIVSMSTDAWHFTTENVYTSVKIDDIKICVKFPSVLQWVLQGNMKIYRTTGGVDTLIYDYKADKGYWLFTITYTPQSANEEMCIGAGGMWGSYNYLYNKGIAIPENTFDNIKVEVEITNQANYQGLQIIRNIGSTYTTKIDGYVTFSYEKRTATNRIKTVENNQEVIYEVLFNPNNNTKITDDSDEDDNFYYYFALHKDGQGNEVHDSTYSSPKMHADQSYGLAQKFTLLGYNPVYIPLSWYTDDTDNPSSLVGLGERRLKLPVPDDPDDIDTNGLRLRNDYVELVYDEEGNTIEENERVELTIKKDNIYPRCYTRVKSVTTEQKIRKEKLSDGSDRVWPYEAYVLKIEMLDGSEFPFKSTFVREGDKLRAMFVSEIDEQNAYDEEGIAIADRPSTEDRVLLAGMEFDVSWDDVENTLSIFTNEDYGAMLPSDILMPKVNDILVLMGWDVRAMEDLGLVAAAEERLLDFAKKYLLEIRKGQFTFTCDMMSTWAEELINEIQNGTSGLYMGNGAYVGKSIPPMFLPIEGSAACVKNDSLPDGEMTSRVLGYEFKMDFPWDTPRYTIGETDAYSRIKMLERSLVGGGYGGGSNSVSYNGSSSGSSDEGTSPARVRANHVDSTTVSDLDDALISNLEEGNTLVWDGTRWVNDYIVNELVFVDLWLSENLSYNKIVWDGTNLYRYHTEIVDNVAYPVEELIPLRTDTLYIDKEHNKPYRWSGSQMYALGGNMEITVDGSVVTIGDTSLNFAHNHDWEDVKNKPNLVEGITIGGGQLKFLLSNGDTAIADFSSIMTAVNSLASNVSDATEQVDALMTQRGMVVDPYVWASSYDADGATWEDGEIGSYWFDTSAGKLKIFKGEYINNAPNFHVVLGMFLLWHEDTGELLLYSLYNAIQTPTMITIFTQ